MTFSRASWVLFPLLVLSCARASSSPFAPQRIKDWIRTKCGNDGLAVWVYEGALYDPLDGTKIANVQGLELVRQLADTNTRQRSQTLKGNSIKGDYSATLLSRKLFCYSSLQEPRRLLHSIRLRTNAPKRKIPVHQAVALYDSATTYVSRDQGRKMVLHTEWPNGKCTWGMAFPQKTSSNDDKSMDFSVFAKPSNVDVPDVTSEEEEDVVVTPKRSQLIQFGTGSPQQSDQSKFGARETYSYTIQESPDAGRNWLDRFFRRKTQDAFVENQKVKYTRYGEGPPWYGVGKYCMLELQGTRVASVEEAPPLAASFAAQHVPAFLSVDTPIASDGSAQRAVEWFRRGDLQIVSEEDEDSQQVEAEGGIKRLAFQAKRRGGTLFHKLRAASTLESNTR